MHKFKSAIVKLLNFLIFFFQKDNFIFRTDIHTVILMFFSEEIIKQKSVNQGHCVAHCEVIHELTDALI